MVYLRDVEQQLKTLGLKFRHIGRPEVQELAKLLMPAETIIHCMNGLYNGAIALICATNKRILIIDKRPLFLNFDDIHFDVINEVDFASRALDSTVFIRTTNKTHAFKTWKSSQLRDLCSYIQEKVIDTRTKMMTMQALGVDGTTVRNSMAQPIFWRKKIGKVATARGF